ncbi:MAG: hypothetical protein HQK96_15940, partial [Nitrospirae bacterium]|nr:hypothetical protein [Nitrospirota bacterium]
INWTITARVILPIIPAISILLMQKIEVKNLFYTKKRIFPIALGLFLSFSVAVADSSFANTAKMAANFVKEKYGNAHAAIWFDGHWGFQYYMEAYGFKAIVPHLTVKEGDLVIVPQFASNSVTLNPATTYNIGTFEVQPLRWLTTMNFAKCAGFYASNAGPLPFAFGKVAPETYNVYIVMRTK